MSVLAHLAPAAVFAHFEALCAIPHGSGNTAAISHHLVSFARAHGLAHTQDGLGNVIIFAPAAPGYEAAEPVILQGHMDMVCEKAAGCPRDMAKEGLDLAVEGDHIYAVGTTLGGDDGIAVAMMLALLEDDTLPRPALECVFTVDEEVGMPGAQHIDLSSLRSRRMINLDSEAEGVFTVSCAGGSRVKCLLPTSRSDCGWETLELSVTGLLGGHSGAEIHRGRANAVQLLARVLDEAACATELRLVTLSGGGKDNAIPRAASAILAAKHPAAVTAAAGKMEDILRQEYRLSDSGLTLTVSPAATAKVPMDEDTTARIIRFLLAAPCGVQEMSQDIPGLVETSLNLGVLTTDTKTVSAVFSLRSSVESRKTLLERRLTALTEGFGGQVEQGQRYPAWAYRADSPLRELMSAVFTAQYGYPPKIEALHAGLECGLFAGKLAGLDCVSIGPDLTDIHTPQEKMSISSVERVWRMLLETLRRMK